MTTRFLNRVVAAATIGVAGVGHAGVIFDQTFTSSDSTFGTSVDSSYTSTTPNSSQFNDISANDTFNSVAIQGGQLVFDLEVDPNGSTAPNPDTGLLRATDLKTPVPTLMTMIVTMTYSRDVAAGNFGPGPVFQIGDFPTTATNYGGTVAADRFDDFGFRRNGSTAYYIELSTTERVQVNFGTEQTLTFFLNDSGAAANYVGPDNVSRSLTDNSVALFVGTTLVGNSHAAANGSSSDLSSFRIIAHDGADTRLSINRITVRDDLSAAVPEPSSLLAGSVLGAIALRRRRVV
jgi:hypothetical protein